MFNELNKRFKQYLDSLPISDSWVREHIDLKVKHTYRVISNMMIIARKSGLSENEILIARIIALVHDIGRFQQFITYRTFDDSVSVNHARFGVKILEETDFFHGTVTHDERNLIVQAVLNHNLPRLDPDMDKYILLFSRLIRDADKVDIWKILTERNVVFKILEGENPEDTYEVTDDVLESFRTGNVVPFGTTLNDYRLLRLSWIYDMNFPATFELIIRHDYARRILAKIPDSGRKDEIAEIIHRYIREKAAFKA